MLEVERFLRVFHVIGQGESMTKYANKEGKQEETIPALSLFWAMIRKCYPRNTGGAAILLSQTVY